MQNAKLKTNLVNTEYDKLWISFWMNWKGDDSEMPIAFHKHDIWIISEYMRWNIVIGDVYRIDFPSDTYINKQIHIVLNFKTGSYGDIMYINGVKQTLV